MHGKRGRLWRRDAESRTRCRTFTAALVLAGVAAGPSPATAAPPHSLSHYEYGVVNSVKGLDYRLFQQGLRAGKTGISKQVVILDFGAPRQITSSTYGQQLFGYKAPILSYGRILQAIQQFSNGYHTGWQTPKAGSITIVWGTNNGRIPPSWSTQQTTTAAQQLATQGASLRSYVSNQKYNRQHVAVGDDIEQDITTGDWNDYPITKTFVDAYNAVTNRPFFINFGSDEIGGLQTPQPCCGQWTVAGVVHVSRSSKSAACPQIYYRVRTSEWTATEYYADVIAHGAPIYFFCVVAEGKPAPAGCTGICNLSAEAAWQAFHDALQNVNGKNYVAAGRNYLGPRDTLFKCRPGTQNINC